MSATHNPIPITNDQSVRISFREDGGLFIIVHGYDRSKSVLLTAEAVQQLTSYLCTQ